MNKQELTANDELVYLREFEHLTLTRILLAEFKHNRDEQVILKALRLLDRLLQAAEDRRRTGSVLEILVTQALVYQRLSSTSKAFKSLERAIVLAQPEGYVRIFVDEGYSLRLLLSDFRKAGITQPRDSVELMRYVDQLLSTFTVPTDMQLLKRFEPEDQQAKTMLVDPLSQRELEVLRLFKTELSGPEIAQQLMIALSTVRIYTKSI